MKFYKIDESVYKPVQIIIQKRGYGQEQAEKFYKKKQGEKKMKEELKQCKRFLEKLKQAICDNTYPYFDKDGKPVNIWNTDGFDKIDELLKEYEK